MDNSKQLVTRSRHALACMSHNGSVSNANQPGADDVRVSGTLPIRYAQIVIKEPGTAEPKRAKRKRITAEQLKDLTAVFENTDTPTHDIREILSKKLGMTNREVQVWFQNRRAKYNRLRLEQQRQMRTNAAIMFSAGMVATRAPVQAPLPLQLTPYAHFSPQSPYPPVILARPPTSTADSSGAQTGDGHHGKCPIDISPVDVTRAAIAGNALLQLSEARPASATSAFARPPLGDSHRYDGHLGVPHMQTPALTSASAVACYAYSESPSASPYRLSAHGPSFRIPNDECMPQYQHKQQQQLMPHTPSGAVLPARRNTVSSYQSTGCSGCSAQFTGADHAEQTPLVYPVSPSATASGPVCMVARDRYRPDSPASHYHRQCRYSTNRSPSPFQSQYRQLGTAFPSAYDLPAAAGSGVKLPSIQVILANIEHVNSKECKTATTYSHPLSRSRAYTSPPLSMVEPQLHTECKDMLATSHPHKPPPPQVSASSLPPWALVGESEGQHSSSTSYGAQDHTPCVNYYQESPVDEAKLAIDMLATAAVSVSSARSSCSLPHLTPLSEFSIRASSQLQCSPTHTPPLQSQESQTAETKCKSSRSWRPW